MTCDDPATVAASHVLTSCMDLVPAGLAARLADWPQQHIALATERSDREGWQWEVTLLEWVCEACGLPELLVHAPVVAEDLMAEAGFAACAMRQAPSTGWRSRNPHSHHCAIYYTSIYNI